MKKKNHFIKFSILMMVQALCLTVLAVEDAEMDAYTKTLDAVVFDMKNGKGATRKYVSDICYEIYKTMPKEKAIVLIGEFGKKLLSLDLLNFQYLDRIRIIENIGDIYWGVWGNMPVDTDKERWEIRLKALEWKKKQLDRLLASPPEDNRPWPEKWQNPRAPRDSEKGQWEDAVFRFKSCFYKSDLRICVQAAEEEQYSEEFRAWCFKEIEKIIGRPLTDDDIMFKEDVLRRRAKRLINRIPSSWEASVEAFTNVAHKVHEAISKIESPTNRLKYAKAYAESLLNLDKFVRVCDNPGYWARLNAHALSKELLEDFDIEIKWNCAARFRQLMKEELAFYDARGSSTPMRIIRRYGLSEERYMELVKENEKRREALKYRSFANQIRMSLKNHYKPIFEWGLKEDCYNLSPERKESLLKMIIEITGETPKWYQEELEENRKTPSTVAK